MNFINTSSAANTPCFDSFLALILDHKYRVSDKLDKLIQECEDAGLGDYVIPEPSFYISTRPKTYGPVPSSKLYSTQNTRRKSISSSLDIRYFEEASLELQNNEYSAALHPIVEKEDFGDPNVDSLQSLLKDTRETSSLVIKGLIHDLEKAQMENRQLKKKVEVSDKVLSEFVADEEKNFMSICRVAASICGSKEIARALECQDDTFESSSKSVAENLKAVEKVFLGEVERIDATSQKAFENFLLDDLNDDIFQNHAKIQKLSNCIGSVLSTFAETANTSLTALILPHAENLKKENDRCVQENIRMAEVAIKAMEASHQVLDDVSEDKSTKESMNWEKTSLSSTRDSRLIKTNVGKKPNILQKFVGAVYDGMKGAMDLDVPKDSQNLENNEVFDQDNSDRSGTSLGVDDEKKAAGPENDIHSLGNNSYYGSSPEIIDEKRSVEDGLDKTGDLISTKSHHSASEDAYETLFRVGDQKLSDGFFDSHTIDRIKKSELYKTKRLGLILERFDLLDEGMKLNPPSPKSVNSQSQQSPVQISNEILTPDSDTLIPSSTADARTESLKNIFTAGKLEKVPNICFNNEPLLPKLTRSRSAYCNRNFVAKDTLTRSVNIEEKIGLGGLMRKVESNKAGRLGWIGRIGLKK